MSVEIEVVQDEWTGCYRESWKGVISDAAFAHPAKFSRALIHRIYSHVVELGWVKPGDRVADPFGGIALGAYDAMHLGLDWVGVELEAKFVALGQGTDCDGKTCPECSKEDDSSQGQMFAHASHEPHRVLGNIEAWQQKGLPGTARLIQGDSRRLIEALTGAAELGVSSPPYAGNSGKHDRTGHERARRRHERLGLKQGIGCFKTSEAYGNTEGQLGGMDEGDLDLAVSSPPFLEGRTSDRVQSRVIDDQSVGGAYEHRASAYGDVEGQLGQMKEGDLSLTISSPPYANSVNSADHGIDWTKVDPKSTGNRRRGEDCKHGQTLRDQLSYTKDPDPGNLGAMATGDFDAAVSSPPYNLPMSQDHNGSRGGHRSTEPSEKGMFAKYGDTDGQLEGMSMDGFDAAIGSPPYPQPHTSGGGINVDGYSKEWQKNDLRDMVGRRTYQGRGGDRSDGNEVPANVPMEERQDGYGESEGQVSAMPAGSFDAAVSSPPWEDGAEGMMRKEKFREGFADHEAVQSTKDGRHPASAAARQAQLERDAGKTYGDDKSNLGNQRGEDFWSASRLILEQLFQVLIPGGHAVFVVKRFVRGGKIVDFPDQWRQLAEAVGFKLLHDHHAMLTEHYGTQQGLESGDDKSLTVARKSFFRRLHEKKNPGTEIDWENILCFEKPV